MIKLSSLLKEQYLGNCVGLICQFKLQFKLGDDSPEPVMWMQNTLGDDDNVYRISSEVFFKYVKDVPKAALSGTDPEYYYIFDGGGHPNGNVNFVLYSTNKKNDDIHYFFSVYPDPKDEILNTPKLQNGYGAGSNMHN